MTGAPPILITGAAGFIGHATALRLLGEGQSVLGIDNFNDYYDPALKRARAVRLQALPGFTLLTGDVADPETISDVVQRHGIRRVIHLAAQAGVRHSMNAPFAFERANLSGHLSVLEACRRASHFEHLVYASSSSVYGNRALGGTGFGEQDATDRPISLYAATKRACELMSESYASVYGFPQTGLRLFTVYGPWGRPDMAYFKFTRAILADEPIEVYGYGQMSRDFTYIDDVVDGILGAFERAPERGENRILNIGDHEPVGLMAMIATLEAALGRSAEIIMRPMQPGDVAATYADVTRLQGLTGYRPKVKLAEGLTRFVDWYRDFYLRG